MTCHPDFWSISIFAVDRAKDTTGGSHPLISYVRSTAENLERVPPGGEVHFTEEFIFRKKPDGVIEVEEHPEFGDEPGYMKIWDDHLWAQFHYGKQPDYLPERAGFIGNNYVMVNIGAQQVSPQP